ncbi:MAG: hypothetical protein OIF57_03165 [Marinobacterium sp.]|nr:hypothetical protein [Marinobacterium sp.]
MNLTTKPDWQRCSGITLMRACISCQHYEYIGWDNDPHCPNQNWGYRKGNNRLQYGKCHKNGNEVFCTEICPHYLQDEGVLITELPNRPAARQPVQQALI